MNSCKFLVTGGHGMLGIALQNILKGKNVVFLSSRECDLRREDKVNRFFSICKPKYVIHLAAKVGGMKANMDYPADFYLENIRINTNVLEAARKYNVKKVISVLSTCIYPDIVKYPLTEEQIHNGPPHFSNFAYAYAKRMLDIQSRAYRKQHDCNFICAVANNLFGIEDQFDLNNSHLIPAIIRKIYEAKISNQKEVTFWGNGEPKREFTYSKDFAKALLFLFEKYNDELPINIGNTEEHKIKEVVYLVKDMLQCDGVIKFDNLSSNGQMRKDSNNQKFLDMGWKNENYTNFKVALGETIDWFVKNYNSGKIRGIKI